jgi:hypothetical protein
VFFVYLVLSSLLDIFPQTIFSQSEANLIFLVASFGEQRSFILLKSNLSFFFFSLMAHAFYVLS